MDTRGTHKLLALTSSSALSNRTTWGHSTSRRKVSWMNSIRASFPMLLMCRKTEQASRVSSTL